MPFTKNDGIDRFHNSWTKTFAANLIITKQTPLILGENLSDGDFMRPGKISIAMPQKPRQFLFSIEWIS